MHCFVTIRERKVIKCIVEAVIDGVCGNLWQCASLPPPMISLRFRLGNVKFSCLVTTLPSDADVFLFWSSKLRCVRSSRTERGALSARSLTPSNHNLRRYCKKNE